MEESVTDTERTTSVTRSYHHLHYPTFMASAFALCGLRTALQQPLNIALVRKQSITGFNRYTTGQILSRLYRHEGGLRAVLRGMPALTLGCASSEVVYLALLECGREELPFAAEATRTAVAGYGADAACRVLHIPLSIVAYRQMTATAIPFAEGNRLPLTCGGPSSRLPTAPGKPLSAVRTFWQMYAERGVRTVFAGLGTTLLIGSQWSAVWWPLYGKSKAVLYEHCTPRLEELPPNRSKCDIGWWAYVPRCLTDPVDNALVSALASAFTSASTAVLFNPFLVLRTNLQVLPNASLWGTAKYLYQRRGWKGFYSGLSLSMTTCVLDGALSSLTYEYARLWADVTKKS